jgi:ribonuclease VapC
MKYSVTAARKRRGRTVTEAVLDASALIAFLRDEPGATKVAAVLTESCISAVNLSETLGKLVEYGKPLEEITYQIERLKIPVVAFDAEHAGIAASLWKATRPAGLSLGDRACLALALKTSLPAFTTEREWSKCAVGAQIVTIR